MAIVSICAIVIVLYYFMAPSPTSGALKGDRYIQIYSATWGMNCNDSISISNLQREQMRLHPAKPSNDPDQQPPNPDDIKPLSRAIKDNALLRLTNLCNGKLTCAFGVSAAAIGFDPLSSCFKHLVVLYRCFTYDRLHNIDVAQEDVFSIDCSEPVAADDVSPTAQ